MIKKEIKMIKVKNSNGLLNVTDFQHTCWMIRPEVDFDNRCKGHRFLRSDTFADSNCITI